MTDSGLVRQIEVFGKARNPYTPDTIEVSITVDVTRDKVKEAEEDHGNISQKVSVLLKTLAIPENKIKTSRLSSNPVTQYDQKTQKHVETGYRIIQSTSIKTTPGIAEELNEKFPRITKKDGCIDLGRSSYSKIEALKESTMTSAIYNANRIAKERAEALGLKLGKAIYCSENLYSQTPQPQARPQRATLQSFGVAEMAVPSRDVEINMGEDEVGAQIKVVYELLE